MMLWVKLAIPFAMALGGAFLMSQHGGKVQEQIERAEAEAAARATIEANAAQLEQVAEDLESKYKLLAEEYEQARTAEKRREVEAKQAIERVNSLLEEKRRLESENEELRAWSSRNHPDDVRLLVNTASATASEGDNQDRIHIEAPASESNP